MNSDHVRMAHLSLWAAAAGAIALVGVLLVAGAVNAGRRRDNETDLGAASRQAHALTGSLVGVGVLVGVMAHLMAPVFASMRAGALRPPVFLLALGAGFLLLGCASSALTQYFLSHPQTPLERDVAYDERQNQTRGAGIAAAIFGVGTLVVTAVALWL